VVLDESIIDLIRQRAVSSEHSLARECRLLIERGLWKATVDA
jgi:hypothetical protein